MHRHDVGFPQIPKDIEEGRATLPGPVHRVVRAVERPESLAGLPEVQTLHESRTVGIGLRFRQDLRFLEDVDQLGWWRCGPHSGCR